MNRQQIEDLGHDGRSTSCLREGRPHGTKGVAGEAVRVDVGMICHDVALYLLQDLVGPGHVEGVQGDEGEQKVAHRRGIQHAGVEDNEHSVSSAVVDADFGVGVGDRIDRCKLGRSTAPVVEHVSGAEASMGADEVSRELAVLD